MTDKNLTEIVAIIDRSGSMHHLISDTIGGFNSFLEEQKKAVGKAIVTRVQFDDKYQIDYEGVDVNEAQALDTSTYIPRGNTALFDAVGKTVNTIGERLSNTPEDQRPGQVIFLIITDGLENGSCEFKTEQVRELVRHQIEKYNWSFVYLGGGNLESQKEQGNLLGISSANVYGYTTNSIGTRNLFNSVSKGITRSRKLQSVGEHFNSQDAILTPEEARSLIVDTTK